MAKVSELPVPHGADLGNPMSVAAVAKDKENAGKKPAEGEKPRYTTLRFFEDDGADISDLADEEGITIAEVYRKYCAELIRKKVIELTEKKLNRLKTKPPK